MGIHDERRRRRAEHYGLVEPVESLSMANKKEDLVAAAEVAGIEVDESMTKAEILEALDGAE